MDIYSYYFPTETFSQVIVGIQIVLLIGWFVYLISLWLRQGLLILKIKRLDATDGGAIQSGNGMFSSSVVEKKSKGLVSIVLNHIATLKKAAIDGNRLEVSLLIKNTVDQLNKPAFFLRSLLSLFIVLGLLGTLGGLANSLGELSSIQLVGTNSINNELAQGLRELLRKLGGAFAPSLWGVSITVGGLFLFSLYQRFTAAPLRNLIEYKTLTDWIPKLFKTSEQNQQQQLDLLRNLIEESSEQSKENNLAVKEFRQAAEKLNSEAGELATNIVTASNTLTILSESSKNLKDFSEKFVEGVSHLTTFQNELRGIYIQIKDDSKTFQQSVTTALAENKAFQDIVAEQFELQGKETHKLLDALKVYEEGYINSRHSIDQSLLTLLVTARDTYEKIGSQNKEVIRGLAAEVGVPLQTKIAGALESVSESISEKLDVVGNKFGEITTEFEGFITAVGTVKTSIDAVSHPLNEAATDIRGIAKGFDSRTETLTKELQTEFEKQNETTQSQLSNLVGLKENVGTLNGQFTELGNKIDSFSVSSKALIEKISSSKGSSNTTRNPTPKPKTRWEKIRGAFKWNKTEI